MKTFWILRRIIQLKTYFCWRSSTSCAILWRIRQKAFDTPTLFKNRVDGKHLYDRFVSSPQTWQILQLNALIPLFTTFPQSLGKMCGLSVCNIKGFNYAGSSSSGPRRGPMNLRVTDLSERFTNNVVVRLRAAAARAKPGKDSDGKTLDGNV